MIILSFTAIFFTVCVSIKHTCVNACMKNNFQAFYKDVESILSGPLNTQFLTAKAKHSWIFFVTWNSYVRQKRPSIGSECNQKNMILCYCYHVLLMQWRSAERYKVVGRSWLCWKNIYLKSSRVGEKEAKFMKRCSLLFGVVYFVSVEGKPMAKC